MSKVEIKTVKRMTPIEVVQKNNPLIKDLPEASKKWNKCWPDIEQPWPVEGTLNPDVIQKISTLVTAYKANEKKRKKGKSRAEKRWTELAMLQLFEQEGQKLRAAAKVKNRTVREVIERTTKQTVAPVEKINTPFSPSTV